MITQPTRLDGGQLAASLPMRLILVMIVMFALQGCISPSPSTFDRELHEKIVSASLTADDVRAYKAAGGRLDRQIVNAWGRSIGTLLLHAAAMGRTNSVAVLIAAGADPAVKAPGLSYQQAIHEAAGNGHVAVIRQLLDAGVDVNAKASHNIRPLHRACRYLRVSAVETLLAHGADPNAREKGGNTPLHVILGAGIPTVRSFGPEVSVSDVASDYAKIVGMLLEAGADPKAKNDSGLTPLQKLPSTFPKRWILAARLLVTYGADPLARDKRGRVAAVVRECGLHEGWLEADEAKNEASAHYDATELRKYVSDVLLPLGEIEHARQIVDILAPRLSPADLTYLREEIGKYRNGNTGD